MGNQSNKSTTTFKIIAIVALIWNALGVFQYLIQAYMTDEVKALLPEADQAFYNHMPAWYTAAFAIAVFAGFFGCLALLIRKQMATMILSLSLLGVLAQAIYNFFIQEDMETSATTAGMPIMIIVVSVFLVWYSKKELN